MKVLLLGEFSGVHVELRDALRRIGIHAIVASAGDGWKEITGDLMLPRPGTRLPSQIRALPEMLWRVQAMSGFDIVQLVHPTVFPFLNELFVRHIIARNGATFLLGAGSDSVTNVFLRERFSRPSLYAAMKQESGGKLYVETPKLIAYEERLRSSIAGYIPLMYEYAQGYRDISYPKLRSTIPIPLNLGSVEYQENIPGPKVVFFHGINRPIEKGTPLILEAMENVRRRYPRDVEVIAEGKMPQREYLKLLRRANVVIDQIHYLSYGVNAVYALAMGKVCVGGGDTHESKKEFQVPSCPMVAVEPTVEDLETKMISVLERKSQLPAWGKEGRDYVETVHCADRVATSFVKEWKGGLGATGIGPNPKLLVQ